MKLCVDCKYKEKLWLVPARLMKCKHPSTRIDIVTGKPDYEFCTISRGYGPCGVEGKLWEAKQ